MSMISTEPAMPDTMPAVEAMSLEAVQTELAGYRPGNQAEVIAIEEWIARRMQLWRRLDALLGARKLAVHPRDQPKPTAPDRMGRGRRVCGPVPHRCRMMAFMRCVSLDNC
jgi:hypothetical protein